MPFSGIRHQQQQKKVRSIWAQMLHKLITPPKPALSSGILSSQHKSSSSFSRFFQKGKSMSHDGRSCPCLYIDPGFMFSAMLPCCCGGKIIYGFSKRKAGQTARLDSETCRSLDFDSGWRVAKLAGVCSANSASSGTPWHTYSDRGCRLEGPFMQSSSP